MPLRNVVRIDPTGVPGHTLVVDLLDASGASVSAYKTPRSGQQWTLPATVDLVTGAAAFYVDDADVWVSAKVNDVEVAASGAVHRVTAEASSRGVLLRPVMDADEFATLGGGSGGSTPVLPLPVDERFALSPAVGDAFGAATFKRVAWSDLQGYIGSGGAFVDGFEIAAGNLYVPADVPFVITAGLTVTATTLTKAILYNADAIPDASVAPFMSIIDNGDGTFAVHGQIFGGTPDTWASGPAGGTRINLDLYGTGITQHVGQVWAWSLAAAPNS